MRGGWREGGERAGGGGGRGGGVVKRGAELLMYQCSGGICRSRKKFSQQFCPRL